MNWTRSFSVGVAQMDAHHQKWFGILNKLHDAMLAGKAREIQQAILAEMVSYTSTHFANEESLLKMKGYPKLDEHQQKHRAFTKRVNDLKATITSGGLVLSQDVMEFLKQWLDAHILSEDVQYGTWMRLH